MDDLGVPLFQETSIYHHLFMKLAIELCLAVLSQNRAGRVLSVGQVKNKEGLQMVSAPQGDSERVAGPQESSPTFSVYLWDSYECLLG